MPVVAFHLESGTGVGAQGWGRGQSTPGTPHVVSLVGSWCGRVGLGLDVKEASSSPLTHGDSW